MAETFAAATPFALWRTKARSFLEAGVPPVEAHWGEEQTVLFQVSQAKNSSTLTLRVPKEFLKLANIVSSHRGTEPQAVLYRLLWRIQAGERQLLKNPVDSDVVITSRFAKAVKRDVHKMHAFVRFQEVSDGTEKRFVAWYRPDHFILELGAPFFKRRFGDMRWSIYTPDGSAHWDRECLSYGEGTAQPLDIVDAVEEQWRSYYAAIFNPARLKIRAMTKEMPKRFWTSLPEAMLIPDLIRNSTRRTQIMQTTRRKVAQPVGNSLEELAQHAAGCQSCPLFAAATQTVFGAGPKNARIVLVGEQPGDEEDRSGNPFVGPAGQILQQAFSQAGMERTQVYLTNAVKHFKFEQRGKRRIHKKPEGDEIHACRPWLTAELSLIKPPVLVCLGATAAQAVLGKAVEISKVSERIFSSAFAPQVIVTYHPSAVLRMPDEAQRKSVLARLVSDLHLALVMEARGRSQVSTEKLDSTPHLDSDAAMSPPVIQ